MIGTLIEADKSRRLCLVMIVSGLTGFTGPSIRTRNIREKRRNVANIPRKWNSCSAMVIVTRWYAKRLDEED